MGPGLRLRDDKLAVTRQHMPIPVIDAHHHIWRQIDLPWLTGPMLPRIFGPYEPIRRDYPIEEFLADIEGAGRAKNRVYVQANWAPERAEDEVAWVQKTADETGWPHAIVGYADLMADDVRPALDRLKKYPLLRGIRMQLHWHANQQYRFARQPGSRRRSDVSPQLRGARRLRPFVRSAGLCQPDGRARRGWRAIFRRRRSSCSMPACWRTFPRAAAIAWRSGMRAARGAAERRLKALRRSARSSTATIRSISPGSCGETVALFGARRCLFGSNFPIEKLWTDYRSLIEAHRAAIAGFSEAEQRAILHDTAARVYRIGWGRRSLRRDGALTPLHAASILLMV